MNIAAFGQIIQHKRGDDFRQRVELLATCAVEFISGTPTRRIRQWR
jgi:hypothetical protein